MELRTTEGKKKRLNIRGEAKVKFKKAELSAKSPENASDIPNTDKRLIYSAKKVLPNDTIESKPGEQKIFRTRAIRKVVRSSADIVADNIEGGEELKESAYVLSAASYPLKQVFKSRREREMARDKTGLSTKISAKVVSKGSSSGNADKNKLKTRDKSSNKKEGLSSKKTGKGRKSSQRNRSIFDIRGRARDVMRQRYEDSSGEMVGGATAVEGKNPVKELFLTALKMVTTLLLPIALIVMIIVAAIGAIVCGILYLIFCSPFSIFFPLPDTGTEDPRTVLSGYYQEFNEKISAIEDDGGVISYTNSDNGALVSNYRDTLMVYMLTYSDGVAGFVMDDEGKRNLKKVFDEMNYIEEGEATRQVRVGDSLGKVNITAYCPCTECSGIHGRNTASGKQAKANHTLAVDYRNPIVPMGTKVIIDGLSYTFTVEDTGDLAVNDIGFDMFFDTHAETEEWGKKKKKVYIVSSDTDDEVGDSGDNAVPEDEEGETITVTSVGATVHNLTYEDYISAHPELNETQIEVLRALMGEQSSIYAGNGIGEQVVSLGMTKLGSRYSQARRMEEGYYDCSSFVYRLYKEFGVVLPLTAAEQGRYIATSGLIVNKEDLMPGDLIFYSYKTNGRYKNISHVAIYAGNGKMIHASNPTRGVVMDNLNTNHVVFYGRVI